MRCGERQGTGDVHARAPHCSELEADEREKPKSNSFVGHLQGEAGLPAAHTVLISRPHGVQPESPTVTSPHCAGQCIADTEFRTSPFTRDFTTARSAKPNPVLEDPHRYTRRTHDSTAWRASPASAKGQPRPFLQHSGEARAKNCTAPRCHRSEREKQVLGNRWGRQRLTRSLSKASGPMVRFIVQRVG